METEREKLAEKITALKAQGYMAAEGLQRIFDAKVPHIANSVTTDYYQNGPVDVAKVVEAMIALGMIVLGSTTTRWWPSALATLSTLDTHGKEVKNNPPMIYLRHATTGNVAAATIDAPTQEAINSAIRVAESKLNAAIKITRRRMAAQQEVDAE